MPVDENICLTSRKKKGLTRCAMTPSYSITTLPLFYCSFIVSEFTMEPMGLYVPGMMVGTGHDSQGN